MAALSIVGAIALLIVTTIWRAYVASILWLWFVASQFGAPAISIPQAIGIALVFSVLTHRYSPQKDIPFAAVTGYALLGPLLLLGMGAVVRALL